MNLIFMGTSEFAVPILKKLHSSPHKILVVITQPDRPKGRGKKLSKSPIKKTAIDLGYTILQPENINNEEFIKVIADLKPDLFTVIAFGQILCEKLLKIPKKGAINVHPSLIPKYRGAAPIQWAIINGDKKTGITTMLMDKGMDTGCILMSKRTSINYCETYKCLHDRLSSMGSDLLLETIKKIQNNTMVPIPQNNDNYTMARLLKKKDGEINWNKSASMIEFFIRGMNPWPGAFTFYKDSYLKIIDAKTLETNIKEIPGTILESCNKTLIIIAKKNAVSIKFIQGKSGKIMSIDSFLCGFHFEKGTIMGRLNNYKI